jgi:hypothetical protein
MMPEYYISMNSLIVDQYILKNLLQKLLPKLYNHFIKYDLDIDILSSQWFLTIFSYCDMNHIIIKIIWDNLLLNGKTTLF